ncbi:MAG: hypothetical protein AAF770_03400, partial [Bacteroidota bacterium]
PERHRRRTAETRPFPSPDALTSGTLLIGLSFLPPLLTTEKKKKMDLEERSQATMQLKVLIDTPKKQKDVTIELPESGSYADLHHQIIKQVTSKLSFFGKKSDQLMLFQHPPSHNTLISSQHKKLTEAGIKDGDRLYAILYHKDPNKNHYITVFVDYEHSDEIIMLRLPKPTPNLLEFQENTTLLLPAKNKFRHLEQENPYIIEHTRVHYSDNLTAITENDHQTSKLRRKRTHNTFALLENGDRVTLRITDPKPITVTVKTTNGEKDQVIKNLFNGNSYVDDIIQYVTKNLHWNIEPNLLQDSFPANEKLTKEKNLKTILRHKRLERCNFSQSQNHITYYVKLLPVNNQPSKKHKKEITASVNLKEKDNQENQADNTKVKLTLVINKLATSEDREKQNQARIKLSSLALESTKQLKANVKVCLQRKREKSNIKHYYYNTNDRLMLYTVGTDKKLKKFKDDDQLSLQEQGVHPDDRIYAIITSKKNPNQVSFFVEYEKSQKIALVTFTIKNSNSQMLIQKKENQIREKVIRAFQRFEIENPNKKQLPLWDPDALEKTELAGKNIHEIENGDLITLRLKPNYSVTITIETENGDFNAKLGNIKLSMLLKDLLQEAKRSEKESKPIASTLLLQAEEGEPVILDLNQSLEEAGIIRDTILITKFIDSTKQKLAKKQDSYYHDSDTPQEDFQKEPSPSLFEKKMTLNTLTIGEDLSSESDNGDSSDLYQHTQEYSVSSEEEFNFSNTAEESVDEKGIYNNQQEGKESKQEIDDIQDNRSVSTTITHKSLPKYTLEEEGSTGNYTTMALLGIAGIVAIAASSKSTSNWVKSSNLAKKYERPLNQ